MKKEKEIKPKAGLARLLELAGKGKGQLITACILSVLSAAARLTPFFTIYRIICEMVPYFAGAELDVSKIYQLTFITFASALIYGICSFISSLLSHQAAYHILFDLRMQIIEKLARIPAGFFAATTQGALKKVVSDDVERIEEFIAHHLVDVTAAIATPMLTMVYLFFMDWRLAIAAILPFIISTCLLSGGIKNPKGAQTQVDMSQTLETMNGTIVEYVHGMSVIKVFNRTLSAFKRFEDDINAYINAIKRAARFFASPMGLYYTVIGAQLLLILPVGLWIAKNSGSYQGILPVLFLFLLVGIGLKEPLENMMNMVVSSNEINIGVARIDNILSQDEIRVSEQTQIPVRFDISFENVTFSYEDDGVQALKDVSFQLKEGSVTGLVGPSGGGKSTVASLLLHFYELQNGRIKIGGIDIQNIDPGKLMELIGYVFQESCIFCDTVEANIRMGNRSASRGEVEAAAKAAHIHEVIMKLPKGYDTVIGGEDAYLSGGEQQRISIARVFLKDAPIILLDEATAYADAENESKIQESFAQLAKNKTVLIIAHRLKSIESSDQILVLKEGRLTESGRHQELLERKGIYKDMVDANERRDRWFIGREEQVNA